MRHIFRKQATIGEQAMKRAALILIFLSFFPLFFCPEMSPAAHAAIR